MTTRLRTRLAKLEFTRAIQVEKRLVIRFGTLKRLPPYYQGERHVATIAGPGSDPAHPDCYEFEERPGPDPCPAETPAISREDDHSALRHADREQLL